ncbi:MAG TPA: antitoxin Xre/MbcA/ParS toxin-binding domain-containing protein [Bryobacteraceae bacterium]|nr:antitoxin Xre/MbcA/ParS toxin-binding domain-containing protein [Bryobacteraceae bacterium]
MRTVDVLGSTEAATQWLAEPLAVLNGNTPMSLLANAEFGRFDELLSGIEVGSLRD